jgi:quinol monooxygenase YgiN
VTGEAKLLHHRGRKGQKPTVGKNDPNIGALAHGKHTSIGLSSDCTFNGDLKVLTVSLFVRLEAKPGKEAEVAAFLKQGLQLAQQEMTTPMWFALRLGPTTFAVFDAFRDEAGRQAHLDGPIAKALMAQAPHLLAGPPVIERMDVLGVKLPG